MIVGILGGGQLARMLALAGYHLGIHFLIYDPDPTCCASDVAPVMVGDYHNLAQLKLFAQQVEVITFENENIPVVNLHILNQEIAIHPSIKALSVTQNRLLEKNFLQQQAIPTAEYSSVKTIAELVHAADTLQYPFILKTITQGYDGKGQHFIKDKNDLPPFTDAQLNQGYIAEKFVHFIREFSIIAVRNLAGDICFYDLCENKHHHGILRTTQNKPNDASAALAQSYVKVIADKLDYVGIIAVEFFDLGTHCIVNEIAPRVHNSGHWTIEGAYTSQFENHLRALTNLPLGNSSSRCLVEMQNMIGELLDREKYLGQAFVYWHQYNKPAKPNRKIGHITKLLTANFKQKMKGE